MGTKYIETDIEFSAELDREELAALQFMDSIMAEAQRIIDEQPELLNELTDDPVITLARKLMYDQLYDSLEDYPA